MKKRNLILAALVLTLACVLSFGALSVSAEEAEPSVTIAKFNLAFEDNTYLKYAVRFDGVADSAITENNIGMLYWTDYTEGFVPGSEDFSSKTTGYTEIGGVKHYVFEYTHLAAKQLTDYVYSIAYLEYGGETYYSEPVKYSALEYAYNRLGKTSEGTTNEELKALLYNMLAYGASAQEYFDYKEDRLATDDFYQITLVGGTLDDGFTSGLYLSTDEVTITAPAELDGKGFTAWQNSVGETVSTDNPAIITNFTTNETYTATYTETSTYSEGLEYTLNDDGESYSVTGIGTCTDTEIIIPSTYEGKPVTSIGESAFLDCTSLTSIVIPNSVTSIGDDAFYNCTRLTSITIPNSITKFGNRAFSYCSSLVSVNIPDDITEIGWHCFSHCISLADITIPHNVTTIGGYAFDHCSSLTSVVIPDSVTSIGYFAFSECSGLTSITMSDSVTSIFSGAFSGCSRLVNVDISNGITEIYSSMFKDCISLTNIIIPDNVTYIGSSAFYGCSSLSNITISTSVISIEDYAFENCKSLTTIIIPDSVTSIGVSAFQGCSSLESITMPDSISSIRSGAFSGCAKLTEVSFAGDIDSWCRISFEGYSANPVYYSKNILIDGKNVTEVTIPTDVTEIYATFAGFKDLKTVTLHNGITSIGQSAFESCWELETITMSDNVTNFGRRAFWGCSKLVSITIPDSVISIDFYAFALCNSLTNVTFENPNDWWYASSSSATSGTSLSAADLADSEKAATYLTSTYENYFWNRTEE